MPSYMVPLSNAEPAQQQQQLQQPIDLGVPLLNLARHKYVMDRVLGRGAFGQVTLVTNQETQKRCVVKRLKDRVNVGQPVRGATIDPRVLNASINEIKALASVRHPFIVEFGEAWVETSDMHLHIAMEYCAGGELQDALHRYYPLPEDVVRRWMVQLLLAVEHLHSRRIIHRDIKLANVFLSADGLTAKLGDFGLSKLLQRSDERGVTQAGTPFYFSPEVAAGETHDRKTDVWSLGVAFYFLLANDAPFTGKTMSQIIHAIRYDLPHPWKNSALGYSPELRMLVEAMLTKDARKRPSASDLLTAPWMEPYLAEVGVAWGLPRERLSGSGGGSVGNHSGVLNASLSVPRRTVSPFKRTDATTALHQQQQQQQQHRTESSAYLDGRQPPSSDAPAPRAAAAAPAAHGGDTAVGGRGGAKPVREAKLVLRHVFTEGRPLHVNIRSGPSITYSVVQRISGGTEITVDPAGAFFGVDMCWHRVIKPVEGFCITAFEGEHLFVPTEAARAEAARAAEAAAVHPLTRPPATRRVTSPLKVATGVAGVAGVSPVRRRVATSPRPASPTVVLPLSRRLEYEDEQQRVAPVGGRPRSPTGLVAPRNVGGRQAPPSPARRGLPGPGDAVPVRNNAAPSGMGSPLRAMIYRASPVRR